MGSAKTDPLLGMVAHTRNLSTPLGGGRGRRGYTIKSEATLVGLHSDFRASQSSVVKLTTNTEHFSLPKASLVEKGFRGACINSFVLEKHREREPAFPSCASPCPPHSDHLRWQEKAQQKGGQGVHAGGGVATSDKGRGPDLHVWVSEACSLCSGQR